MTSIDPDDLATTLKVLAQLPNLEAGHPDLATVKQATGRMYKQVRKARRREARQPQVDHDEALLALTATGSPMRIDDETKGITLVSSVRGAHAGELMKSRGCYICKTEYTLVDAFYHWLCPDCAQLSHTKRDQRTDLTGRRALLTGGRAKIGMYIALRLLRDGAHLTITTRFPHDAARRFAAQPDSADWLHRLKVVGIDLRDPTQVVALADEVAAAGPLDILINNAAQTVRRSPGAYTHLVDGESVPLPSGIPLPELVTFDRISDAHPANLIGTLREQKVAHHEGETERAAAQALAQRSAASMTSMALSSRAREPRRPPRRDGGRRRWAAARRAAHQLLDPEGRGGRPTGAPRGPALQLDRAVHPHLAAASGHAGGRGGRSAPRLCRQRLARWKASSPGVTRARATRTRTWPRQRSTCSPGPARGRCSRLTRSS